MIHILDDVKNAYKSDETTKLLFVVLRDMGIMKGPSDIISESLSIIESICSSGKFEVGLCESSSMSIQVNLPQNVGGDEMFIFQTVGIFEPEIDIDDEKGIQISGSDVTELSEFEFTGNNNPSVNTYFETTKYYLAFLKLRYLGDEVYLYIDTGTQKSRMVYYLPPDKFGLNGVPDWVAGNSYSVGVVVKKGDSIWRSRANSNITEPSDAVNTWENITPYIQVVIPIIGSEFSEYQKAIFSDNYLIGYSTLYEVNVPVMPLGVFSVKSCKRKGDNTVRQIEGYDRMQDVALSEKYYLTATSTYTTLGEVLDDAAGDTQIVIGSNLSLNEVIPTVVSTEAETPSFPTGNIYEATQTENLTVEGTYNVNGTGYTREEYITLDGPYTKRYTETNTSISLQSGHADDLWITQYGNYEEGKNSEDNTNTKKYMLIHYWPDSSRYSFKASTGYNCYRKEEYKCQGVKRTRVPFYYEGKPFDTLNGTRLLISAEYYSDTLIYYTYFEFGTLFETSEWTRTNLQTDYDTFATAWFVRYVKCAHEFDNDLITGFWDIYPYSFNVTVHRAVNIRFEDKEVWVGTNGHQYYNATRNLSKGTGTIYSQVTVTLRKPINYIYNYPALPGTGWELVREYVTEEDTVLYEKINSPLTERTNVINSKNNTIYSAKHRDYKRTIVYGYDIQDMTGWELVNPDYVDYGTTIVIRQGYDYQTGITHEKNVYETIKRDYKRYLYYSWAETIACLKTVYQIPNYDNTVSYTVYVNHPADYGVIPLENDTVKSLVLLKTEPITEEGHSFTGEVTLNRQDEVQAAILDYSTITPEIDNTGKFIIRYVTQLNYSGTDSGSVYANSPYYGCVSHSKQEKFNDMSVQYGVENISGTRRDVIESFLQLHGLFINFDRYGVSTLRTVKYSTLYPKEDLYPHDMSIPGLESYGNIYPTEGSEETTSISMCKSIEVDDNINYAFDGVQIIKKNVSENDTVTYPFYYNRLNRRYGIIPENMPEIGYWEGNNYYVIEDNFFIDNFIFTQAQLVLICKEILNNIGDLQYFNLTAEIKALPYMEVGDNITITTPENGYETAILRRIMKGVLGMTDSIETDFFE